MKRHDVDSEGFELLTHGAARINVRLAHGEALDLTVRVDGPGPRVLVVGGTHGDEFEGQIAALELARALPDLTLRGTLIVLALHNPMACRAGQRVTPADGRDLNRAYGCDDDGGPTARIAKFVSDRLLTEVDLVIDLHSGGRQAEFVLSSNMQARPGSAEHAEMRSALMAFDAPYAITFDEAGVDAMPHAGTLEGLARARGRRALSSELGGTGGVTTASLGVARQGLVNLLHHFGSVTSALAVRWQDSRSVELFLTRPEEHLTAPVAGWFVPDLSLGDQVMAGDSLGYILPDDDPLGRPVPVRAATTGVIAALFHPVRCCANDVLAYVAATVPKTSAGFR
jgi:N2-acetyl-L-2,4-diaminobutanoate deacetylase